MSCGRIFSAFVALVLGVSASAADTAAARPKGKSEPSGGLPARATARDEARVPAAGTGGAEGLSEGPPAYQAIRTKVIELMEQELGGAARRIERAETLLAAGNSAEAGVALREARLSIEAARRGLGWVQTVLPRWEKAASSLSVIKIRVVRERRRMEKISERAAPVARAWARVVDAAFSQDLGQVMEAEVIETHTIGKRFAAGSLMGKLRPVAKRRDLLPGRTIELEQTPRATGMRRLEEGQTYWVVITPPLALDAVPRAVGAGRRADIVFAARAASSEVPDSSRARS